MVIRARAKQLHSDAWLAYDWLLGVGRDKLGAEADSGRRTANYLLRLHGWNLGTIGDYKADHETRKARAYTPPLEEIQRRQGKTNTKTERFGESGPSDCDVDSRYFRVLDALGWSDPIRADATPECAAAWIDETVRTLAELASPLAAKLDAKSAYGPGYVDPAEGEP